jgi:hypothetical protein
MNERILKLFMQACRHADYEHQNVPKDLVEKFSELIVKECMAMCDETQAVYSKHRLASLNFTDKNRYAAGEQAADTIYSKIKQHFGVE